MVRYASRFKPLAAALAALFATLVLGGFGPALPGATGLLSWELFGLATVGGTGLLAWHLAQLTALPAGPLPKAALPAALIPLAVFPHIGAAALLVPVALALPLLRIDRFAGGLALAGTLAMLGPLPLSPLVAGVTMLGAAWLCRARCPAANDNPSLERLSRFWSVPVPAHYARDLCRDSGSEFGE
ncbi:hypothetical protein P6144_14815 [Sphingomonas sp. HITSZ_GF]|uniref:hypothetical protein n=1 Tax=Sphingomonas sp. HITSZ_GF TaxID=3037247 RepID=UPI00240D38BC|nr:hypothetical protein [Sphingomonas sp. HITSZ_GF]MDG2534930.1 hypothetical protein [Sphingomonas sp. HITSZ_GF]